MEFFRRAAGSPQRLGVFPGAFNPPTRAHLALAHAALTVVDEVVFVVPRVFPHKRFDGASFEERTAMLQACLEATPAFSLAASHGGLYVEIAEDCRTAYPDQPELSMICGRDAAERIVNWDYGRSGAVAEMLDAFDILVASRRGGYSAPSEYRHRIRPLDVAGAFDHVSATEVRNRIEQGEPWQHLVPREIAGMVHEIYLRKR